MDSIKPFFSNLIVVDIIVIALSVIVCFWGYKLEKLFIAVAVFALGGFAGYLISTLFSDMPLWGVITIVIVCAVLSMLISFKLYLTGVFLLCFALVAVAAYTYIQDKRIMFIVAVVGGIIAGILGISFTRPVLVITSALCGGITAIDELVNLVNIPQITTVAAGYIPLVVGIVLGVIGMVHQFRHSH